MDPESYCALISAAREIALSESVDDATRDSARGFLRREFDYVEAPTNDGDPETPPEEDDVS